MAREAVGIDIGGTAVKLGRVDETGRILSQDEIPTPVESSPEEFVHHVVAAVAGLPEIGGDRVAGKGRPAAKQWVVGVGCAGLVSSDRGIIHTSPNLPRWREVSLGELLERELGRPTYVLNDANAFALAEARIGAGRGHSPVVALTLGTGVGGAIVSEGRVFGGRHGFAGEIGHMSIDLEGRSCPCGNSGCLELHIGKRGIVARYLDHAAWRAGTPAFDLTRGEREALSPKILADAVRMGEVAARKAFSEAGEILGAALTNLSNLLDPAVFVVGGGVSQAGNLILEPARRILSERAMIPEGAVAPVVQAALGVDAGLIGAALFALDSAGARVMP